MHLAQVLAATGAAVPAFSSACGNHLPWHDAVAQDAATLMAEIEQAGRGPVLDRLTALVSQDMDAFRAGLRRYLNHPFRRPDRPALPVLAQQGDVRVHDYGGDGPAILMVPSLINGPEVLDLLHGHSLVQGLNEAGVRPLLLDWGMCGTDERALDIDGYITDRLIPMIDQVVAQTGGPISVLGYCMGGLLSLAACLLSPGKVRRLALLATPWDFHQGPGLGARIAPVAAQFARAVVRDHPVPVDVVQSLFAGLDPLLALRKFGDFGGLHPDSQKEKLFVAVEDWANGGPPLAAGAARQCLADWYGANRPALGQWTLRGDTIRPEDLAIPTLCAIPAKDRIVPAESALALAEKLPQGQLLRPASGHVGMVVSRRAPRHLYQPLAEFFTQSGC